MIRFDKGTLEIRGANYEIMTDFNFIIEEILDKSPEIVLATFFVRAEQLKEYINKCDPVCLELSQEIIKKLLEAMEEVGNE